MEALDYLQTHEPDLVIADVRLPGISGIELLKKVRNEYPAIIVILVAAFATVAEAVEAMRMGAHDYLAEPVSIDNLKQTVRRLLMHFQHQSDGGALMDRKGQIEAASGGTLFLDEIGEMPPELQVKLLRLLQGGEIQKVGAATSTTVDVRVIAATHRDLFEMVQSGAFRDDLYYRLNVIPLTLPSLRERREDIAELVEFFFDRSRRRHGRVNLELPEYLIDRFVAYRWPGNIRELENVIERIVVLTPGTEVGIADLPLVLRPEPTLVEMIGLDLPPKGIQFRKPRAGAACASARSLRLEPGEGRPLSWPDPQDSNLPDA